MNERKKREMVKCTLYLQSFGLNTDARDRLDWEAALSEPLWSFQPATFVDKS
jgi:hypothetical protein